LTPEVALFTTEDGLTFDVTALALSGASGNFGLGLSFGEGNSIWGNTQSGDLVEIFFDPNAGTASVNRSFSPGDFPGSIGPIVAGTQYGLLAGISNENPDNIQIFDISNRTEPPVLLDQEFLSSDNPNTNGTGSLAFGNGVLVALGTNNGLTCLTIDALPIFDPGLALTDVEIVGGNQIRFTLNGDLGKTYTLQDSPDLTEGSWTDLQSISLTESSTQTFTFGIGNGKGFFRVREGD
jgi:hypothetical protein